MSPVIKSLHWLFAAALALLVTALNAQNGATERFDVAALEQLAERGAAGTRMLEGGRPASRPRRRVRR